jgi:hypothetical protein
MTDMALDTHALVKTLTAAGMPEAQAEAVTTIVRQARESGLEILATRDDLVASSTGLKTELGDTEARFKLALGDTEARFKLALGDSEARLKLALAETKADIMKWMIGTVGGAVIINAMTIIGAMLALTKMVGH